MNRSLRHLMTSLAMGFALMSGALVQAAPVTEVFDVEVVAGPGAGAVGLIEITFDSDDISGSGEEVLGIPDIDIVLDILGQVFSEEDDTDFPGFPVVEFFDGLIVAIDFVIGEDGINSVEIIFPGVFEISGYQLDGDVWPVYTNSFVPLPASAWLLGSALMGLGLVGRRRQARRAA